GVQTCALPIYERFVRVRSRPHDDVVVVEEAEADRRAQPAARLRGGLDRVAQPLGGPGERRARRQLQRLLDLGRGLPGQTQHRQREARVEARELLQLRVRRAAAAEGL